MLSHHSTSHGHSRKGGCSRLCTVATGHFRIYSLQVMQVCNRQTAPCRRHPTSHFTHGNAAVMHDTYGRVDLPPISRSLSLLSSQPGHQAAGTVTSDCMLGGGEPQPIDERNAPIQRITADCRVRRACIYPYTLKREHYHTAQRRRVPSQQNRGEQECIACCLPLYGLIRDLGVGKRACRDLERKGGH